MGNVAKAGLTQAKRSEDGSQAIEHNEEDDDDVNRFRRQTHMGRPCRTPAFLTLLESLLSRVLVPNRRGRKRKTPEVRKLS
jgi:hypothetical protein